MLHLRIHISFLKIIMFINDNCQVSLESTDYFDKIRPMVTRLKNIYSQSIYLAVDENTVAYKSRFTIKQYLGAHETY